MYASEPKDPFLIEPADGDSLWRYQTFCKFQSLVKEGALFFCQLDKLADPQEGKLPSATDDSIKDFLKVSDKDERIMAYNGMMRFIIGVNCWHLSDYENAFMWCSYANPGVAIKTTFAALKDSLRLSPPHVTGGIVQYLDHDKDEVVRVRSEGQGKQWSSFEMAVLKYPSFEGEKEFRVITNLLDTVIDGNTGSTLEPKRTGDGIFVPVNLYRLLNEVVISPDADYELESKIRKLMEPINEKLPLNSGIPVNRSTLYA